MKLQKDRRYVRRDGKITGPLIYMTDGLTYPFMDPEDNNTYTPEGYRVLSWDGDPIECPTDLVSLHYEKEYTPVETTISDPSMMVISVKEYNRLKAIEAHLKQVNEVWNELQTEKA